MTIASTTSKGSRHRGAGKVTHEAAQSRLARALSLAHDAREAVIGGSRESFIDRLPLQLAAAQTAITNAAIAYGTVPDLIDRRLEGCDAGAFEFAPDIGALALSPDEMPFYKAAVTAQALANPDVQAAIHG